jgi:hypothetical protein
MPILTQSAFNHARNAIREAVAEAGWTLQRVEEIADVSYDCILTCTRWRFDKPPAGSPTWLPGQRSEKLEIKLRVRESMSLGDALKAIRVRLKLAEAGC